MFIVYGINMKKLRIPTTQGGINSNKEAQVVCFGYFKMYDVMYVFKYVCVFFFFFLLYIKDTNSPTQGGCIQVEHIVHTIEEFLQIIHIHNMTTM